MFSNKTLLITGGTGSFGTAMVDKLISSDVKEIRILSRDEKKQDDMRNFYRNEKLKFYIGDVKDYQSIAYAFINVDYVFHAAALKQVPTCEFFPLEALKTNILGSNNVIDACLAHHVKRAVFLSTDKAVMPLNALGMSKGLMEKNIIARSHHLLPSDTILTIARYGNILATRGSVIPNFLKQIEQNIPLTITNPYMSRFMMSIDDALSLVINSLTYGQQGDIFVKKAPAATIDTLTKALLKGLGIDHPITYIGTRHGEKDVEMLVTSEESLRIVDKPNYSYIPADKRNLDYNLYFNEGYHNGKKHLPFTSENTEQLDVDQLLVLLRKAQIVK